jgi:hypothetical protein
VLPPQAQRAGPWRPVRLRDSRDGCRILPEKVDAPRSHRFLLGMTLWNGRLWDMAGRELLPRGILEQHQLSNQARSVASISSQWWFAGGGFGEGRASGPLNFRLCVVVQLVYSWSRMPSSRGYECRFSKTNE